MPERSGPELSCPCGRLENPRHCDTPRSLTKTRQQPWASPYISRAPRSAPTPKRLQDVCPGTGQHLEALNDDLTGAAVLPLLRPPPPLQAPLDQDAAAFAQRGAPR